MDRMDGIGKSRSVTVWMGLGKVGIMVHGAGGQWVVTIGSAALDSVCGLFHGILPEGF
jgi:hypothetical protein